MIRTRARGVVLLTTSILGLTLITGCAKLTSTSTTSTKSTSGQGASGQGASGQGDFPRLIAKNVDNLGIVVTDRDGMTLYRFDKDTSNPPASTCEGQCAQTWPPATTTATRIHLEGVDQKLVGTVARKDGTVQLTLGGWPLYRYAKDAAPGDVNGQGVGKTWYAATPEGKKAAGTAPVPGGQASAQPTGQSTGDTGGGSGY